MSEAEDLSGRLWRKEAKLERRLGPDGERPKGMHRRTFERIDAALESMAGQRDRLLFYRFTSLKNLVDNK
jgi:hypothetical protein